MKRYVVILALFMHATALSQESIDSLMIMPDSAHALTLESFYQIILDTHPVARQAHLLRDVAREEIRLARGNFDPKVEWQYLVKNYNDTEYYRLSKAGIKLPSVFPIDPSIGVERNTGQYLNPQDYISNQYNYRQLYAGLALPLGKGLLTDERRATLRQAHLFTELTEAEQIKLVNKLLLEASKDYWHWFYTYYQYQLQSRSVRIADEILRRVRLNAAQGEAAVIDTVQASITWQQRVVEKQEAFLSFQNAGLTISNYLWDSVGSPVMLDMTWVPVLPEASFHLTPADLTALAEQARQNHPELKKLSVKINQLEVDRRLAVEFLKPRLDLNYYFINQPLNPEGTASFTPLEDYKFGVDFSFPLFIRKERAKLNQTKIKIRSTQLERDFAERQILNEITATYNSLLTTHTLVQQQSGMVRSYERLLQAELLNLENGESDLFKINIQQEKLIQSQSKLLKLKAEYEKNKAMLWWAAGVRHLNQEWHRQ